MSPRVPIPPAAMAMARFGGREYPAGRSSNCHVCQSPHRQRIEELLHQHYGYQGIINQLPPDHGLHAPNISHHVAKGHITGSALAWRKVVETRAKEIGESIESGETLGDYVGLGRLVVLEAMRKFSLGEMPALSWSDVNAFSKLLAQVSQWEQGGFDAQAVEQSFIIYWTAMTEEVGEAAAGRIGRRIERDPIMQALLAKHQGSIEAKSTEVE